MNIAPVSISVRQDLQTAANNKDTGRGSDSHITRPVPPLRIPSSFDGEHQLGQSSVLPALERISNVILMRRSLAPNSPIAMMA